MKLNVFKMKDGVEKNWDDVDYDTEIEVIASFEGETNDECEEKAADAGYDDVDSYGWAYCTL